jgi:hypothetical protein
MHEFGTPDELPDSEFSREALSELQRIAAKAGRLVTIAAVYLAAEQGKSAGKTVQVDRDDVLRAAKLVLVRRGKSRVPWLNDFADAMLFESCFLSHSTKDRKFCDQLYQDLKAKGVACWYFPETATWGQSVWGEIDRGIQVYDRLLVVCSERSLTSPPVLREIERALQREDDERRASGDDRQVLFPITLDNFVFDLWKHPRRADVLAKVIGNFQGTTRSRAKYDAALVELLKHLQPKGSQKRKGG